MKDKIARQAIEKLIKILGGYSHEFPDGEIGMSLPTFETKPSIYSGFTDIQRDIYKYKFKFINEKLDLLAERMGVKFDVAPAQEAKLMLVDLDKKQAKEEKHA